MVVGSGDCGDEMGEAVERLAGPNRIVMEINRETTGRAKLNLSSQLLRLAKVYPK